MQTYKTKLVFDNPKARAFWVGQMRVVRDCFNYVSKIAFDEKTPLNLKVYHNRFYRAEREAFPTLPAQMCIKVYKQVLANYRTVAEQKKKEEQKEARKRKWFEKKGLPVPKKEPDEDEEEKPIEMKNPSIGLDKRLYSNLTRESFKLSDGESKRRSLVKFVLYPKFNEMAARYRMCDPTLQYDEKNDVFYACVPFLTLDTTPLPESYIGVDLGMKRIATLSDGTAIVDKDYLARRRRIRHNKSVFKRHKKKSHSARRKLNVLRRKERNMCKDFCHHVANEILKHDGSVIVMEDLSKIKKRTAKTEEGHKRKRHNNAMSQVPFFQLKQILTYKAPLVGKRVETVPPQYTSQEDCRTQSKEGCVRKGCRFYTADGMVFDADWNASINICNRKHPTPFRLPLDGRLNFVGRRRQHANSGSGQPDLQAAASSARR